jgi:hypothetical protein
MEDYWSPIVLGAAENELWTEVAGLFRAEDVEAVDPDNPVPTPNVAGMFRAFYLATGESSPLYGFTNPAHSAAERRNDRIMMRGAEADIEDIGRRIHKTRFDALVQLLHSRGRIAESCLLKSNRFPRSGCWLAGPGGYFAGATNLSRAEYKMALRLRLLRSPASLDVGDAEGGIVCRCNRRINLIADPMHFFHCPSSQGQFIRRHNHIRDAIMDQIGDAVDMRPDEGPHIEVEWEPRVLAHVSASSSAPPAPSRADGDEEMEVEAVAPRFAEGDEEECIEEAGRIRHTTMSITDLRQRNAEDKAAGQRRCDLGVYVDGARLVVDVAVADATAPSYRRPPPRHPPHPDESQPRVPAPPGARGKRRRRRDNSAEGQDPRPRLPGESFAIEHRVQEKKSKYRPLLGAAVEDLKRFVPFVLEASGRLGPEAGAFLEYLQSICSFPILRFRALVCVLSAKHNARMALRWVRFLRHPI